MAVVVARRPGRSRRRARSGAARCGPRRGRSAAGTPASAPRCPRPGSSPSRAARRCRSRAAARGRTRSASSSRMMAWSTSRPPPPYFAGAARIEPALVAELAAERPQLAIARQAVLGRGRRPRDPGGTLASSQARTSRRKRCCSSRVGHLEVHTASPLATARAWEGSTVRYDDRMEEVAACLVAESLGC